MAMRKRFVRTLGIAAAVVLTVVACGAAPAGSAAPETCGRPSNPCAGDYKAPLNQSEPVGEGFGVVHVRVDGRDVPCVIYSGYRETSISCDWSPR